LPVLARAAVTLALCGTPIDKRGMRLRTRPSDRDENRQRRCRRATSRSRSTQPADQRILLAWLPPWAVPRPPEPAQRRFRSGVALSPTAPSRTRPLEARGEHPHPRWATRWATRDEKGPAEGSQRGLAYLEPMVGFEPTACCLRMSRAPSRTVPQRPADSLGFPPCNGESQWGVRHESVPALQRVPPAPLSPSGAARRGRSPGPSCPRSRGHGQGAPIGCAFVTRQVLPSHTRPQRQLQAARPLLVRERSRARGQDTTAIPRPAQAAHSSTWCH
jgi:hypothetical protein